MNILFAALVSLVSADPTRFLVQSGEAIKPHVATSFLETREDQAERLKEKAAASEHRFLEAMQKLERDRDTFSREEKEYSAKAKAEQLEVNALAR